MSPFRVRPMPPGAAVEVIDGFSEDIADRLFAIEISAHDSPWSYDGILSCFENGNVITALNYRGEMVGFAVFMLIRDEAELLTIGLQKTHQGRGLGRLLMEQTLGHMQRMGAVKCFLEVSTENAPAIGLYKSLGFHPIGIRKGYYPRTDWSEPQDAISMCMDFP